MFTGKAEMSSYQNISENFHVEDVWFLLSQHSLNYFNFESQLGNALCCYGHRSKDIQAYY